MSDLAHRPKNPWIKRNRRRGYVAAGAALVALVCSMGCLSLQFGGKSNCTEDASMVPQTSSITIPKGQELTVYYPKAFASPPNLELDNSSPTCKIVEQKADHFRVRNDGATPLTVTWSARGMPGQPAGVGAQPTVVAVPGTPTTTVAAKP
jgi:hypothetical protein